MILDPASSTVLVGDWPPADCLSGSATTLNSRLPQPISTISPEPPFDVQNLAAFKFELLFDHTKVCIMTRLGAEFEAAGGVCIFEQDGVDGLPQPGRKVIGCVASGKGLGIDELQPLVHVDAYPLRGLYLQLANDPAVAISIPIPAQNCEIGDEHGHAIPMDTIDPCADAELTFTVQTADDDDGDGCSNAREAGLDETLGGQRDATNHWDFYDTNGDQIVDLSNDIFDVIQHYAPTGTEPTYDIAFDRGPSAGPNAWNMTAPDGVIDLTNDIMGVIQQYQHDCR